MTIMNNKPGSKPKAAKPPKAAPVVLTPEQQAAYILDQKQRIEAARERERLLVVFEKGLGKMSQRQLQGTLRRFSRDKTDFLMGGMACVLSTILANTKTAENPFAKLSAYPL